jgi:hypothetical protein
MTRKYSSTSVQTTLAADINNSVTSMTVATGSAITLLGGVILAAGNVDQFTVVIDPDTINEEVIFVTAVASDTLTVVRGRAGTTAVSHTAGATVRHVLTSDDLDFYTAGVATANGAIPKTLLTTKGDVIGIFDQYAHINKGASIHSSVQLKAYKQDVNDRSRRVPGGLQRILTVDGYEIPLVTMQNQSETVPHVLACRFNKPS